MKPSGPEQHNQVQACKIEYIDRRFNLLVGGNDLSMKFELGFHWYFNSTQTKNSVVNESPIRVPIKRESFMLYLAG